MRSNDNSPSVMHFNVLGYLVCFSVLCLLPLTLLAERPAEITRFTSQREKSPGIDISTLQTATQPEVEVTVISGIDDQRTVAQFAATQLGNSLR